MKMTVLVKLIFVASVLYLITGAAASSPYSNDIDEELDQEPVDQEYLPSLHDITECNYVRHFGPYSGNISCPNTAAALMTLQTRLFRQPSGVSPSNQHLPTTNWSMQCDCPHWSHQGNINPSMPVATTANGRPRSMWRPFITFYSNTSFRCYYSEFLSGLAYQYDQESQRVDWWGRCTRFRGYFIDIRGESCHDSVWRLPDGADKFLVVTLPMTALHGVDDYPIVQQSSTSLLPSDAHSSGSSNNRREKRFQECTVSPVPGCDNPAIDHGSASLLPPPIPRVGELDLESGKDRTKYGDSLQVSCSTGYYVDGPSVITCQSSGNGTWTQLPTCKPCRQIRNCLSVECRRGNESFCLECKAYTNHTYYHIPLKLVLNKNRKRCRIVPHIDHRKVPTEITYERWAKVRLDCPSVGRPAPTIRWTSLTTNKSIEEMFLHYRWTMYSNGSLLLKYLYDTDEGVYVCTAVNDVGSYSVNITLISKEADLRRALKGNSSLSAPMIHNKAHFMLFFQKGLHALLRCTVSGNPRPIIKWYKLEVNQDEANSYRVPLEQQSYVMEQHEDGTLEFYWIDVWNVGIYTCIATNEYGTDVMHKYICVGNNCEDYFP